MSTELKLDFLHRYTRGERRDTDAPAYQYDEGHTLKISVPLAVTTAEIHYWQNGMAEADAYEPESIDAESDGTYTITANVPNVYFDGGTDLSVFVVVTDDDQSITTYEGRIPIVWRTKPGDYVDENPDNGAAKIMAISFSDPEDDGNIVITIGAQT